MWGIRNYRSDSRSIPVLDFSGSFELPEFFRIAVQEMLFSLCFLKADVIVLQEKFEPLRLLSVSITTFRQAKTTIETDFLFFF
jgi:hypothetical protein